MSPDNTPVFLVKKPDGFFGLVQYLRAINQIVQSRHLVGPNPYTLLSKIPRDHKWFSVIDLKDEFWVCPLAEESRDFLLFNEKNHKWEENNNTDGDFCLRDSQNLLTYLDKSLNKYWRILNPPPHTQIKLLQYVDDLLILGDKRKGLQRQLLPCLIFWVNRD
jgi:hypothetical protein